jgi:DNA-binding PadR family transcriptional regulator
MPIDHNEWLYGWRQGTIESQILSLLEDEYPNGYNKYEIRNELYGDFEHLNVSSDTFRGYGDGLLLERIEDALSNLETEGVINGKEIGEGEHQRPYYRFNKQFKREAKQGGPS